MRVKQELVQSVAPLVKTRVRLHKEVIVLEEESNPALNVTTTHLIVGIAGRTMEGEALIARNREEQTRLQRQKSNSLG